MYVRAATLEDIPDIIDMFRKEAYTTWDRTKIPYDARKIEAYIRSRFHEERMMFALEAGKTMGFMWTRVERMLDEYKPSIIPVAFILAKTSSRNAVGKQLIEFEKSYANHNGFTHPLLLLLRDHFFTPFYRGKGFTEYQTKDNMLAEAPRDRRRHWGPGRGRLGGP